MGLPIATKKAGFICFAFPDVCMTPAAPSPVAIPYPNIGKLDEAEDAATATGGKGAVTVAGDPVILAGDSGSRIPSTLGDQAGSIGAINSVPPNSVGGEVKFTRGSSTVQVHGKPVVRMTDPTTQNSGNARGTVLGGVPNVLVGG